MIADTFKAAADSSQPMLIGNNDHEGNIIVGATIAGLKAATALGAKPETVTKLNNAFDWAYNGESSAAVALRWILKFIEDGVFNCPAAGAAEARVKAGVPIWRFRFMGVWKNTNLGGLGAFHVSDVPLVLGTSERKQGAAKNEPEQDVLIKNVMTAWSTFAKDPDDGLTKLGWPKYNVKGRTFQGHGVGTLLIFTQGIVWSSLAIRTKARLTLAQRRNTIAIAELWAMFREHSTTKNRLLRELLISSCQHPCSPRSQSRTTQRAKLKKPPKYEAVSIWIVAPSKNKSVFGTSHDRQIKFRSISGNANPILTIKCHMLHQRIVNQLCWHISPQRSTARYVL